MTPRERVFFSDEAAAIADVSPKLINNLINRGIVKPKDTDTTINRRWKYTFDWKEICWLRIVADLGGAGTRMEFPTLATWREPVLKAAYAHQTTVGEVEADPDSKVDFVIVQRSGRTIKVLKYSDRVLKNLIGGGAFKTAVILLPTGQIAGEVFSRIFDLYGSLLYQELRSPFGTHLYPSGS